MYFTFYPFIIGDLKKNTLQQVAEADDVNVVNKLTETIDILAECGLTVKLTVSITIDHFP